MKTKQEAKQRVLFVLPKPPGQNRGRVILNWSGDPLRDLDRVAESYHSVACDRLQVLQSNRPDGLYAGDEFEAYPIVFLYRQAFELSLKAVIFAGADLLLDEGEEPMPLKALMKHDLMPLFEEASRIFERMGWDNVWELGEPGLRTRASLEKVVREFDYFDRGSYTFRYTMKTDGTTSSLGRGFEFDLFIFAEIMERILARLAYVPTVIREEMQGRWEAADEAQQEAWANADYEPPDYDYEPPDYEPPDYDPDPD
jgi:hypothetical protein